MHQSTTTRWLVTINPQSDIEISELELTKYAPINHVLDQVSDFGYLFIQKGSSKYLVNYDKNESDTLKSKLLITKLDQYIKTFVDMTEADQKNAASIIEDHMINNSSEHNYA